MCAVQPPSGVNPIAVKKYVISYHKTIDISPENGGIAPKHVASMSK